MSDEWKKLEEEDVDTMTQESLQEEIDQVMQLGKAKGFAIEKWAVILDVSAKLLQLEGDFQLSTDVSSEVDGGLN